MQKVFLFMIAAFLSTSITQTASAASTGEVKRAIEGIYALDEWHIQGRTLRPPQVDGRFVLQNGSVVTILLNNSDETNKTSSAQFGVFILDETSFSYRYDTRSSFRQTPGGILPGGAGFDGVRKFLVSVDARVVHLKSGQQEFIFTPEGMTYSEEGKLLRVWRRIKGE